MFPCTYKEAYSHLETIGQTHILTFWKVLNIDQKEHLLRQIGTLDIQQFLTLQQLVKEKIKPSPFPFEPFKDYSHSGNENDRAQGLKLLSKGCVGTLIVSGGQGTRL